MDSMLTQTSVLARPGRSKGVLAQLLGEPDLRKKVFGRTSLSALYLESRVVAAENSDAYQSLQASLARKSAAAKAVVTKTNQLLAAVEVMRVDVIVMRLSEVHKLAIASYNAYHEQFGNTASPKSDAAFLNRICVNFIRHELTECEYALADVAGKIGITKAVDGIRQKVYSAIARAYAGFATECERQCAARQDQA